MTVALITASPKTIIQIFLTTPNPLELPNGDQVNGAFVGWTSQDNAYSIVAVTPFATPSGQVNSGAPSYSFDANGNVVEIYATQVAPAPIVSSLQFFGLFTQAEQIAIATEAETDPNTALFMSESAAAGSINLGSPQVAQALAYLVSKNLITSARSAQIISGVAPT
jgi:hypothetical protein